MILSDFEGDGHRALPDVSYTPPSTKVSNKVRDWVRAPERDMMPSI